MGLFSKKKKKKGSTLTDEDRENALIRRKQLKEIRDLKHQQELLREQYKLIEVKQELEELKSETEEEENFLGLGSQELMLANILTGGKLNNIKNQFSNGIGGASLSNSTPPQPTLNKTTLEEANKIYEALPKPLINQLKGLNPEAVKIAINKVYEK